MEPHLAVTSVTRVNMCLHTMCATNSIFFSSTDTHKTSSDAMLVRAAKSTI